MTYEQLQNTRKFMYTWNKNKFILFSSSWANKLKRSMQP